MSTGLRFALPFQTVIDSTGVPLPGAQLFFYLSGSSTLATTYADQGLTTPNPNPVPAGSDGRFGDIFLNPTTTYKVVLKDANGAQQWTADPVLAPGANTSSYLTYATIAGLRAATGSPPPLVYVEAYSTAVQAPTGGGWFAYDPADTSSTDNGGTIIVDASGNRYYRLYYGACSIDNFGAVQDSGLTDNASAINATLTACRNVLVPGSTTGAWYGFAETLTIHAGTRLSGIGKTSVLKANGSFGGAAPLLQNATTNPASVELRDDGIAIESLFIDGNSQGTANISLVATGAFRIRDVRLVNGTTGILISAATGNPAIAPQYGWIEDVYASNFSQPGLSITSGFDITVANPVVDTCGTSGGNWGIQVQAAGASAIGGNVKLVNPIVRNCGGSSSSCGIGIDGGASTNWSEMEVLGGTVDAQTGAALGYRAVAGLQISGLNITSPTQGGIVHLGSDTVGVRGLIIDSVKVTSAGTLGFYLLNDAYAVLNGCVATGCTSDAVRLDGSTNHTDITGGAFTANGGYGVSEVGGGSVDFTKIWGANRSGNTLGRQNVVGANSVCDDVFVSAGQSIANSAASQSIPHGLGMVPKSIQAYLKCVAAGGDNGYSNGNLVLASGSAGGSSGHNGVNATIVSGTNVGYAIGDLGLQIVPAGGGAPFVPSASNWQVVLVAKGYY